MTIIRRLAAAALLVTLAAAPVLATELDPNDIVTAPSGATALKDHLFSGAPQRWSRQHKVFRGPSQS
jgi:hypothetical protein